MSLHRTSISIAAGAAALIAVAATAAPAAAKDWRQTVANHYEAADLARFVPRGDNPQWDFTLDTVMDDMAWRQRTARILRQAPKPGLAPETGTRQLADRPEPSTLRFSF